MGLNVTLAEVELPQGYRQENIRATHNAKEELQLKNVIHSRGSNGNSNSTNCSSVDNKAKDTVADIIINSSAYASVKGIVRSNVNGSNPNPNPNCSTSTATGSALPPRFATSNSIKHVFGMETDEVSKLTSNTTNTTTNTQDNSNISPMPMPMPLPLPIPKSNTNMSESEYTSNIYNGPSNANYRTGTGSNDRKRTNDQKSMDNFKKREKLFHK